MARDVGERLEKATEPVAPDANKGYDDALRRLYRKYMQPGRYSYLPNATNSFKKKVSAPTSTRKRQTSKTATRKRVMSKQ